MEINDTSFELASVPEAQRDAAIVRFRAISPFLEKEVPLTKLSRSEKIPLRTIRRWVAQYQKSGFKGLIRVQRKTLRSGTPNDMRQLIEGLSLQSAGRTISCIKREVEAIGQTKDWPILSYATLRRIVRGMDRGLVSLAHEGPKAYGNKFDLIYRREAKNPNHIWQADHTLLDCWLQDENGVPARPWLSIILDDFSRSICAYNLSFDAPVALRTALMLRQAIWRKSDARWHMLGIPERFYTDHGSDFTSKHMEQVAADIKMQLTFSLQGKPRGRGKIERFFGTVNELFLCHIPGNMITGGKPEDAVLTISQLNERFYEWLLSDYQKRIHSELDMSPTEKWEQYAFIPRMPESLEQLDLLLLTVAKPRMVQPDGIHFQSLRYINSVLASYVRESVIIRYNPEDLAEIRVYHNSQFLCRAFCGQLESQKVSLKEIEAARRQRKKQLSKVLTNRQKAVEHYIQAHSAVDDLVESVREAIENESTSPKLKKYKND